MGVYDIITWHADLPDLPEGRKPWQFHFQTKDLPGQKQRQFEVRPDGRLQQRVSVHLGEPVPEDMNLIHEHMHRLREQQRKRFETGALLDEGDYTTTETDVTATVKLLARYGAESAGLLAYEAHFEAGWARSVRMIEHRLPDRELGRRSTEQQRTRMNQFEVTPAGRAEGAKGGKKNG